jgi:nucleotide-binding universal stress UspA family protein
MAETKLLIPLDGSEVAESALAEALRLARALKGEVIFLQVIPPPEDVIRHGAMVISIDEQWEALKARALQYLNSVRSRHEWREIETQVAVEMGNPAEVILDYCQKGQIDRIIMATHGRTGIKRWVLGSVADKILRAADRTVVLVRAVGAAG